MGRINVLRVVLGGLLAGLVINVSESILNLLVIADSMELAMREYNMAPPGGSTVAIYMVVGFLLGIVTIWIYAAIRPRFGPGPKTAVLAGFVVWLLAYFWRLLDIGLTGLFDPGLLVLPAAWGLVEIVIAALAGGWLYQEAEVVG
ncbi:MAG: hypothetical protein GTO46_03805 [Gemmatimonadetes bacterium]|nr:hypothetical protein [Gemmatimonadota bacterium]NIO32925.1 hypothetical protein [Gemmatimonadota bacterium]